MKTEVVMTRQLFGMPIKQKSKSEFFSATDLEKAGNKFRAMQGLPLFDTRGYFKRKETKEFIEEVEHKYSCRAKISGRGRGKNTWVHPLVFIDMALSIDPKLKVEVYSWLFDYLLRYRNDSGDSFKAVSAALNKRYTNQREFIPFIKKVSKHIRDNVCHVKDWETANEKQLELRDKIHRSIITLSNVLNDPHQIVTLAIKEHIEPITNKV